MLMKCGRNFILCKNCDNITISRFSKCHKCLNYIDLTEYKQNTNIDKYNFLIKALMNFEMDVLEGCYSMISISNEEGKSFAPELHQIQRKNNEYIYTHLEKDTHKIIKEQIINPEMFNPELFPDQKYQAYLIYGPHVIFVNK